MAPASQRLFHRHSLHLCNTTEVRWMDGAQTTLSKELSIAGLCLDNVALHRVCVMEGNEELN